MTQPVREALARLPLLGQDTAGPLGSGLLASGVLGVVIRQIQATLFSPPSTPEEADRQGNDPKTEPALTG